MALKSCKSTGIHQSQAVAAATTLSGSAPDQSIKLNGKMCAPHSPPELLSQALGSKEIDSGELGLQRQTGARGNSKECLHTIKAQGEAEEQYLLTARLPARQGPCKRREKEMQETAFKSRSGRTQEFRGRSDLSLCLTC